MFEAVNANQVDLEEQEVMHLADDMAAAATTFKGQGYSSFLEARETFKTKLKHVLSRLKDNNSKLMEVQAIVTGK